MGRLKADGDVVRTNGSVGVTKIAIDPVWYLPGIAERFNTPETNLRRALFEQTAGMFPELVTRPDLLVLKDPPLQAEDQGALFFTHPAVAALYPADRRIALPTRYTLCGGPALIEALDYLADVMERNDLPSEGRPLGLEGWRRRG